MDDKRQCLDIMFTHANKFQALKSLSPSVPLFRKHPLKGSPWKQPAKGGALLTESCCLPGTCQQ